MINLGLSLDDVRDFGVEDESVSGESARDPRRLLEDAGRSRAEIDYLVGKVERRTGKKGRPAFHWSGRRAEMNGLIGRNWPEFVARKLTEAGAAKVIPATSDLAAAYRRAVIRHRVNEGIAQVVKDARDGGGAVEPPPDLEARVRRLLEDDTARAWDDALAEIAGDWTDRQP